MAVKFDTLLDEQTYSECISEMHTCAPRIAMEIADHFIRADASTDAEEANMLLDRVVDYTAGVLAGAEQSNNTDLAALARRLLLTLVWSSVYTDQ